MSDTARPRLRVSREGIALIKSFEGFRPDAERRADGQWVIGHGHMASAREGLSVEADDAELLLQYDLLPVVAALNDKVTAPLNPHQFDALASFAISIGVDRFLASDVLATLNEGHAVRAADALARWPEADGGDAVLRRRMAERALFFADPASPASLPTLMTAPWLATSGGSARSAGGREPAANPPPRPTWSETGAYMVIGGLGLLACGAAAVAFRIAFEEPLPIRETSVIAWVLAVIGVACVALSAIKLYSRAGPSR